MRKVALSSSLILMLTVTGLVLCSADCEAAPNYVKVQIRLDLTGDGPEIYVKEPGNRFVGVCRGPYESKEKHCQGNRFEWQLVILGGGDEIEEAGSEEPETKLDPGQEVLIWNAPGHPSCFGKDPVHKFDSTNYNVKYESGPPLIACAQDKYGSYWAYVIEYWVDGELKATTDPGAIIFP